VDTAHSTAAPPCIRKRSSAFNYTKACDLPNSKTIKKGDFKVALFASEFFVLHSGEVFAQCNGLAIHAPVKSPDTGRTGGILMEVGGYVVLIEDEIYVLKS
jgi:hypothetical protein